MTTVAPNTRDGLQRNLQESGLNDKNPRMHRGRGKENNGLISSFVLGNRERRSRLLRGLRRERDLGVEETSDDADGQADEVEPREEVVATDDHA